ncbi:MAG TPA: MazG family protein, partial [Flammeovirgaceae bacterium]|nr:MazG family protein [Flammeovirgaceae bacterium]
LKEKANSSVLGGVPASLPALVKAIRMQEKAAGVGFDWDKKEQVWHKVEEELAEFKAEAERLEDKDKLEAEFGDVLFSLVNYARFIGLNPENALERTNRKFRERFQYIEQAARKQGQDLHEMTLDEMDKLWEQAKSETD